MLTEAAMNTNKTVVLGKAPKTRKLHVPSDIKAALKSKEKAHEHLNSVENDASATTTETETATSNLL